MLNIYINKEINYGIKDGFIVILIPSRKKYLKLKFIPELEWIFKICNHPIKWDVFIQKINVKDKKEELLFLTKYLIDNNILVKENQSDITDRYYNQKLYFRKYKNDLETGDLLYNKIRNASITIVGAGAVGSNLSVLLAATGIRNITMIDGDFVEESNLTRQLFYTEEDVGTNYKVNALKERIKKLNSEVGFNSITDYISSSNRFISDIEKTDLIVQTADKPFGKIDRVINEIALDTGVPSLHVHSNLIGPLVQRGREGCYNCFEKMINEDSNNLYNFLVDNYSIDCRTTYPSIAHGSLKITELIFSKLIEFYATGTIATLQNNVYDLNSESYRYFETVPSCLCNNRKKG